MCFLPVKTGDLTMVNWLVVYLPLWKILVSWNDSSQYMESHLPSHVPNHQPGFSQLGWWHSQYMEKYKSCSKPPISNYYCIILNPHYTLKTHGRFGSVSPSQGVNSRAPFFKTHPATKKRPSTEFAQQFTKFFGYRGCGYPTVFTRFTIFSDIPANSPLLPQTNIFL